MEACLRTTTARGCGGLHAACSNSSRSLAWRVNPSLGTTVARPTATARRGRGSIVRAGGAAGAGAPNEDTAPAPSMSVEDAARVLGLTSSDSLEACMERKNKLLAEAGSDTARAQQVETAYDVMFMQSMRRRLTGEVSTTVRFADVPGVPASQRKGGASRSQGSSSSSSKMPSFGGKLPLNMAVASPNTTLATQQAAVFGALAVWAIIQAVLESPEAQMGDTAGAQLTLALAYSVYTLKENKRMGLGKAVGLSFGGLVLWALLGTAVNSWLRVDIVPLGSFSSPGVFCSEFVIVGLGLGAVFLV